uniref:Uncharacterized protein n=1 Tax=Rangifer tarandus platyrhynchus TaxID=3082113 RepID=A0ACB0F992_RANTA|nr:unnamed protein product [Rangifer tarandus platyrhynchus]
MGIALLSPLEDEVGGLCVLEDKRPDRSSEGEATGPHCAVRRGPSPGSAPGRPRRASASSPVKWGRAAGRAGAVPRAAARGRPWPLRRPRAGIALDLLLFITPARPAAPVNTFLQRVIHRPADSWSRPALRTWGWAWRAALGAQPGQTEAPASPRDRRARAPGSCSNDSVLEEADASRLSTAPADSSPWKAITCFQPCRPCFLLRDEVPLTAGDRFGVGGAAGAPTKLVKGFGGRRAAGPGSRVVSGGRGGGRGVSRAIAACPASRPARDPAVPLPRPRRREHCRLLQMLGLGVTRRRPDAHKRRRPRHRRCCPKWPPALALKSNRRKLAATSLPLSVTWTCDPPPARRHHVVRDPGSPGAREAGDPRLLPAAVGGTPGESLAHT